MSNMSRQAGQRNRQAPAMRADRHVGVAQPRPYRHVNNRRTKAGGQWLFAVIGVAVAALAVMAFFAQAQGSKPTTTTTTTNTTTARDTNGGSAPASAAPPGGLDLSVPTIEGGQYSFGGQAGKPMLLFASASWCLPCLGEVPKLARLYQTYKDQGLQVVALDIDPGESPQAWQGFKSRGGGADHVWAMDPGSKVALALGIQATDTKIIFNRAGKEIFRTIGPTPYEVLDQHVQEALR